MELDIKCEVRIVHSNPQVSKNRDTEEKEDRQSRDREK